MLKRGRGSWDDPLARATRGLSRPSLDARSWDHPTYPFKVTVPAALLEGGFEHPTCRVIGEEYEY